MRTRDPLTVEGAAEAGLWVPAHHGPRFQIARLLPDRRRTQETAAERYRTLADARAACDRRNGRGTIRWD